MIVKGKVNVFDNIRENNYFIIKNDGILNGSFFCLLVLNYMYFFKNNCI